MLVELLVGMTLMAVVGTLVLDAITSGFRSQRQLQDRAEALEELRRVVQRVTRDIREAAPVVEAHTDALTVQHLTPAGTTMTRSWAIDTSGGGRSLVQTTTVGAGAPTTATVISDLVAGTTATFTYEPSATWAAQAGISSTDCLVTGSSPLTYSQSCIGKVTLTLTRTVRDHTPVSISATVDVRNAL